MVEKQWNDCKKINKLLLLLYADAKTAATTTATVAATEEASRRGRRRWRLRPRWRRRRRRQRKRRYFCCFFCCLFAVRLLDWTTDKNGGRNGGGRGWKGRDGAKERKWIKQNIKWPAKKNFFQLVLCYNLFDYQFFLKLFIAKMIINGQN